MITEISKSVIESLQTEHGGWTKESLAKLGIQWPPPQGWKQFLEEKGNAPIVYTKGRYPALTSKGKCRGCGSDVPKGRQTWCSKLCWERHCPQMVRAAVRRRDNHVCQICKRDINQLWKEHHNSKPNTGCDSPEYKAWEKIRPNEEYDHIIPFSEGGKTVIENMRTVCSPCHKQRTKDWHKSRKK